MSLFNLSPLRDVPRSLPQLSPSKPQFTLPPLDEHAPGVERLLGSLRENLMIAAAQEIPFEPTPKEEVKDEEGDTEEDIHDDDTSVAAEEEDAKEEDTKPATEQELWAQAALAGPSRVEVCYADVAEQLTLPASDMDAICLGDTIPFRETAILRPADYALGAASEPSETPDTRVEPSHYVVQAARTHASRDTGNGHERLAEVEPARGAVRLC